MDRFSEVDTQASTITLTAILTANVDIQLAYELLPVIHPKNPDGSRFIHPINTRNKIPYFGVENAVVCVKYKGKIRGIRQNKGQMNNVASIDLQTGNKNVNIKLAKTRVQLTGANSEGMGEKSFKIICSHINLIQSHLHHIRCLSEELRQKTIAWVIQRSFVEKNENEYDLKHIDMNDIQNESEIDTIFATFLWNFCDDFDEAPEYSEKLSRIIEICYNTELNICDGYVDITDCNVSNSVYNYNIGKEVSLIGLTRHLSAKGFSVSFHNWNSTQLKVSMPIFNDEISENDSDEGTDSTGRTIATSGTNGSNKIKAHRFTVHRKLSIKQTSPTCNAQAMEAKNLFLEGISDFPELMEYEE
jgi:hypothetical protein